MRIAGDEDSGRWGDAERGRLKDEEMRSGRAGEREMRRLGKFLFLLHKY